MPPKVLQNTAYISTTSFEEVTTNNHSTATVTAEDTDNYEPVEPTDQVADPEQPGREDDRQRASATQPRALPSRWLGCLWRLREAVIP